MKDCLSRIHLDIIEVWNFRDPEKLLSGNIFHAQMLKLIEPLMPQPRSDTYQGLAQKLAPIGALSAIFGTILPPLAVALSVVGIAIVAIGFLFEKYRASPETAICLEAYIIDLTLFLHELFLTALKEGWRKPLNKELVSATFNRYKETKSDRIHERIQNHAPSAHNAFKGAKARAKIQELIQTELHISMPE
ncbi:hypothetical protein H0H92_006257 [Tricholoma furcatifolium]|nr:hypothetical protein H0H92_006257 [Tricholoma furcatifolium]